jgi:hypothetical protein
MRTKRVTVDDSNRKVFLSARSAPDAEPWPSLPLEAWSDTCATLHLWTQIVGKIRLAQSPRVNHSWSVTLYVTARGLTTSPIPYGTRVFQIDFDFIDHQLPIRSSDGRVGAVALQPQSVASFYRRLWKELNKLDLHVKINLTPNEVQDPLRFDEDERHRSYDADYANRFWRVLLQSHRVFTRFRARFIGKCSPVHFFWGAPDLAVTRFSGRAAPTHPGGIPHLPDAVTREAYSQEVSSCGFWPGGGAIAYPAFYSYAYPEPQGFAESLREYGAGFYSPELREFILPYDAVRLAASPDETLLGFLQATYEAAANLGGWDRQALEASAD